MEFEIYIFRNTQNEHFIIVEADCYYQDYGIGFYEYWGFKGYDSQKVLKCDIDEVYLVHNKNIEKKRKINFLKLKKEVKEEIRNKIYNNALVLSKESAGE